MSMDMNISKPVSFSHVSTTSHNPEQTTVGKDLDGIREHYLQKGQ